MGDDETRIRKQIADEIRKATKARESWNMLSLAALVERGDFAHYRSLNALGKVTYWKEKPYA